MLYDSGGSGCIVGLFWTFPWCEQQWKRFPWVLQADNTYKTNKYRLLLFQVIRVANTNQTFTACFGFIDNECEEGYRWLIQRFEALWASVDATLPGVFITDWEANIKTALTDVYGDTVQQQLCIFHINKNMVLNIKKKWKKPLAPASVGMPSPASTPASTPAFTPTATLAATPVATPDKLEYGHLYWYGEDNRVIPPLTASPEEEDDDELQRLNSYVKTGQYVNIGKLPDCVENSWAGLFVLWRYIIYGKTEGDFNKAYAMMKRDFKD